MYEHFVEVSRKQIDNKSIMEGSGYSNNMYGYHIHDDNMEVTCAIIQDDLHPYILPWKYVF